VCLKAIPTGAATTRQRRDLEMKRIEVVNLQVVREKIMYDGRWTIAESKLPITTVCTSAASFGREREIFSSLSPFGGPLFMFAY
jgi:hypothetical protein